MAYTKEKIRKAMEENAKKGKKESAAQIAKRLEDKPKKSKDGKIVPRVYED